MRNMSKKQKQKKKVENVTKELQKCHISTNTNGTTAPPGNIVLDKDIKPDLLAKWPRLKCKVPPVFLHNPADFEQHARKMLNNGVKFYQPVKGKNYIRITCESFNDHKYLLHYLDKKQLPYHTFGNPLKRKMKVVMRGLPSDVDLNMVKQTLKSASIPVIRVHKMQLKEERIDKTMLILAVVPYDKEGKNILRVTKLLDHDVKLEPPITKPRQCYRCQKWGHSQRYCHSTVKCVKCGQEHLTKKCEKTPDQPPKCANCGDEHTANYKNCLYAPGSEDYKMFQELKIKKAYENPLQIVTIDHIHNLFRG